MTKKAPPYTDFLAPRYWFTWLGIGMLCLAALTPFRIRMILGAGLGWLTWCLARERRYITAVNLDICFPELDALARAKLVKASFLENGIGLVETACGWIRPPRSFQNLGEIRGGEALQAALDLGKGIVLFGGHYTTLDFSANLLSLHFPFAVTYRPHKNPLFDAFMLRGRQQNCNGVFDRKDIRGAFKHLRQGKILWYAPDQDYGPDQAVYAPFFGRPAATITAGSRFANFNQSPVFIMRHHRDTRARKYVLEAIALPEFPTGDDLQDATLVNVWLEDSIRINPGQYLWMHKRFKTNPGGKPESPYIQISTPNRKLNATQYAQLTHLAVAVTGYPNRLQLQNNLQLRTWPGLAKGFWRKRHPAVQLDVLGKHLRSHGVSTVTVDSVFRFRFNNTSSATCFVPEGSRVTELPEGHVPPATAANLLGRLHGCGCAFRTLNADNLLYTPEQLAVDDPLQLWLRPGSAAYQDCVQDLLGLASILGYGKQQEQAFFAAYLQTRRPGDQIHLSRLLAAQSASADNVRESDSELSPL